MYLSSLVDVVALEIPRVPARDRPIVKAVLLRVCLESVQDIGAEERWGDFPWQLRLLEVVGERLRCTRRFDFAVVLTIEDLEGGVLLFPRRARLLFPLGNQVLHRDRGANDHAPVDVAGVLDATAVIEQVRRLAIDAVMISPAAESRAVAGEVKE
ncbi:hypothetical protein D3C87_1383730 [compost metagenome]